MIEATTSIALKLHHLPDRWYGLGWPVLKTDLGLVESERESGWVLYRWPGLSDYVLVLGEPFPDQVQIHLDYYWSETDCGSGPELQAMEDRLLAGFERAVSLAKAVLGEPDYCGWHSAEDCPIEFETEPSRVAIWERKQAVITIQSIDAHGDRGPWIIMFLVIPPLEE